MLIVNDEQCRRSGIGSLSKRCSYCSKAESSYPLILSDDGGLYVYHAACAAALATEILVDLYTFFRPPAPYHPLYVLMASQAVPCPCPPETAVCRSIRTRHSDAVLSAKMVSKARLLLPEPDRPVMTTSFSRGMVTSMFLRVCTRAPRILMFS
jgi:hypothetical protein